MMNLHPLQRFLMRKGSKINKRLPLKIKDWKLFRGDTVAMMKKKERGKTGTITHVDKDKSVVVVEGLNMRRRLMDGKFVMAEQAIHYSNLQLLDPESGKPTRAAWRYTEEGEKVRIAIRSGAVIPIPDQKQYDEPPEKNNPEKNTSRELAMKETYVGVAVATAE
eukprot:CAMPEP_0197525010 /NCGR_PEP_ID=MMETSP1318-20131121/10561_1 /TAXON_ID=552666 /ORGANISM="Partenskyella glossopodia, Strain RCC365" /LENGTH=163 /DNA_ID=CAMNT_0043078151 /DNA_START=71 /DNA_END=562 /DNA_ORIENTATION=+